MKVLFSTGTLYQLPLKDVFLLSKEAGFDGCDLVINRSLDDPHYKEVLREVLDILPVYSLHVPYHRLKFWGSQIEALKRSIDTAKEFGVRVVNFHPPSWFRHELQFYRWFRKIRDFQREVDCGNVFLTIENMPLIGRRLRLAPYLLNDFRDLIDFGTKRNLYFTFDTTHLGTFEEDPIAAFLKYHATGRLKNVHLSDCISADGHLFLGRGTLPIARLLNTMRALGYDEMVTLEVAPNELPVTADWLIKTMSYAASFMKLHLGQDIHGKN